MSALLDSPQGLARPITDLRGRWGQLALGLICMMAISSPQYVWALFTKPLLGQLGASLAQLQVIFSILIVLQTFFSPFQGYLVDRFGPRMLMSLGAILTGASWVLSASAQSVTQIYLTYGLLGCIGTGVIYVGVVGLMFVMMSMAQPEVQKWPPKHPRLSPPPPATTICSASCPSATG
jgi:MFS family permease